MPFRYPYQTHQQVSKAKQAMCKQEQKETADAGVIITSTPNKSKSFLACLLLTSEIDAVLLQTGKQLFNNAIFTTGTK
ncbi:hypothetical protein G9A89_003828 [Geosiphon pyriformis]|nr:hypothetical protein G9A89_003828 [Geosiphon pyriformis]